MHDEDGAFAGAVGLITDITERKNAEAKLHDSQLRLQRIFDHDQLTPRADG